MTLEELVEQANQGDPEALEELVRKVQDRVYGLSLRMLWYPQDAEDATQEILIRVVTHLSTFRKESSVNRWIYRIACNYLLTTRKRRMEIPEITFDQFAQDLDAGLIGATAVAPEAESSLLAQEIKIGCTQGMLLCLDRKHRLAYILGEILELTNAEGAAILDISDVAFRKRLSRARVRIRDFMNRKCGILNPDNRCRCGLRVSYAIRKGRVDPDKLLFAEHPVRTTKAVAEKHMERLDAMQRAAALYRSHPDYAAPDIFLERIRSLLKG